MPRSPGGVWLSVTEQHIGGEKEEAGVCTSSTHSKALKDELTERSGQKLSCSPVGHSDIGGHLHHSFRNQAIT